MERTTTVAVIGGGAAGLTAAHFLARAGVAVEVFDQDRSILKRALLKNLPGTDELEGRELLTSLRSKLTALGVPTSTAKVDDVQLAADGFSVVAFASVPSQVMVSLLNRPEPLASSNTGTGKVPIEATTLAVMPLAVEGTKSENTMSRSPPRIPGPVTTPVIGPPVEPSACSSTHLSMLKHALEVRHEGGAV